MERDRRSFGPKQLAQHMAKRARELAALVSDERLAELEALVSSGRADLQWKLDLVRSARAAIQINKAT
jgi:hypothetical protein